MATDPEGVVQRVMEEAWDRGELAIVDEVVSPSYVNHDPTLPFEVRGPEGVKQHVRLFRAAFPDLTFRIEEQVVDGERVVTRWTGTGTHRGDFAGIPPTGRECVVPGVTFTRFRGGKVVEDFAHWDSLGLLRQLGVAPMPAAAGAPA